MATVTAQVVLKTVNNLPEDFVSNTFHFSGIQEDTDTSELQTALVTFYNEIRIHLSAHIAQNGHMVKYYLTEAPKPNYPYSELTFNLLSAPTGVVLPTEVALCLSYQGKLESGLTQKRRRGRIYIGPLSNSVNAAGRPNTTNINQILASAQTLAQSINVIPDIGTGFWGVWSPTNLEFVAIKTLSIDNAFDTQRRRGVAPTTRTEVVLALPT